MHNNLLENVWHFKGVSPKKNTVNKILILEINNPFLPLPNQKKNHHTTNVVLQDVISRLVHCEALINQWPKLTNKNKI